MKKVYLIFIFLLSLSSRLQCQDFDLGVGIGTSVYWGDLNAPDFGTNILNVNFAAQGSARYNMSDYISARAILLYGQLKGDDQRSYAEWQKQRNLDFHTHLLEFALLGEIYIFGDNLKSNFFSPYFTGGLGVFYFNPTTIYQGVRTELQPLGTEGQGLPGYDDKYSKIALSIPFGAGAKFRFSESMTLSLDIIARRSLTDYLDDVSTNYVNYNELAEGNGVLAAALADRTGEYLGQSEPFIRETGSLRGGTDADYYFTFMATVSFTFGNGSSLFGGGSKVECPTF